MPNVTSPLILSACGNGGQHFAFSPLLSQRNRGTCDLAPAITDFISYENRVCCNNDLEQTLMLLHSEWSKEIEPSGQSSTHHQLVVINPIDKKGSEFMRRSMRWEAPSMPTLLSFVLVAMADSTLHSLPCCLKGIVAPATWHLRSLSLFRMKIECAATTILNRHQCCSTVHLGGQGAFQGWIRH